MYIVNIRADMPSRVSTFTFDLFSDTHIGSGATEEKRLKKHIADAVKIKEEGFYACGHAGDIIDGILPDDKKRWEPHSIPNWLLQGYKDENIIQAEYDRARLIFAPLKGAMKFILKGDGKHDKQEYVANCYNDFCDWFGAPQVNNVIWLRFTFKRDGGSIVTYNGVIAHGNFAGRKDGGKINNIADLFAQYIGIDFVFVGHGHSLIALPKAGITCSQHNHIEEVIRWYGMAGGYILTYPEGGICYAEQRLYPVVVRGHLRFTFRPFAPDRQERFRVDAVI